MGTFFDSKKCFIDSKKLLSDSPIYSDCCIPFLSSLYEIPINILIYFFSFKGHIVDTWTWIFSVFHCLIVRMKNIEKSIFKQHHIADYSLVST